MSSKINGLREFGKFRLDAGTKVLWCENTPVNLPLKEIEMLCVLTEKGGEVISKEELLNKIWADSHVEESNLSRNIYGLRKMFKRLGVEDELIQTVPRLGYRFTGEVHEVVGAELVIEKHTQTRTLIEIEEETRERRKVFFPASYLLPVVLGILLLGVAGALAWRGYQNGQFAAISAREINSIAVLPLKPIAASEADKVLSLGLADALITRLGASQKLVVRPAKWDAPHKPSPRCKKLSTSATTG
jgi:DNA-binding winged helix-turn-helix (wHTH) protein